MAWHMAPILHQIESKDTHPVFEHGTQRRLLAAMRPRGSWELIVCVYIYIYNIYIYVYMYIGAYIYIYIYICICICICICI